MPIIDRGQLKEFPKPGNTIPGMLAANIRADSGGAKQEYVLTGKTASAMGFALGVLVGWGLTLIAFENKMTAFANACLFFLLAGLGLGNMISLWTLGYSLESQWIYLKLRFSRKRKK